MHLVFWADGSSPSDADHLAAGDLGKAGGLSVAVHGAGAEVALLWHQPAGPALGGFAEGPAPATGAEERRT